MWEYIIAAGVAVFVFMDAKKRGNSMFGWAAGVLLNWGIVLPIYFAKRYLLAGETRDGGTAWNICKYFVLTWTGWILIILVACVFEAVDDEEIASVVFCSGLCWILPLIGAAIIGFMMRKNGVVETGPTGFKA